MQSAFTIAKRSLAQPDCQKTAGKSETGFSAVFPYSKFGKIFILPNSIQKSNIPFGDIILKVELAKIPVLPNRGDCLLPVTFYLPYHR